MNGSKFFSTEKNQKVFLSWKKGTKELFCTALRAGCGAGYLHRLAVLSYSVGQNKPPSPLALPLGELSPQATERAKFATAASGRERERILAQLF